MAVYKPTDEIKIPQSKYDKLKEDYLKNPKTAYSLYAKFNKEYPMDKKVFIEIIDKIRIDEGATAFNPIKKTKRANKTRVYSIFQIGRRWLQKCYFSKVERKLVCEFILYDF